MELKSYVAEVDFQKQFASRSNEKIYLKVMEKYGALSEGDENRSSVLFFDSNEKITKEQLQSDFGQIEVLSFEEIELE